MFSFPEAAHHLGIPLQLSNPTCFVSGASIDTRTLELGNLFIALRGSQADGHRYLEEAFLKGASGALIEQKYFEANRSQLLESKKVYQNLLPVQDTQEALLRLAKWYRLRMRPVCVGITGSVGKTSTKEFLYYLLRKKFPVAASMGNFNNHLGLPLTLLSLQRTDRYCIAELGANHVGEIAKLADTLQPTRAILTQVSPAHLKGFGSLEAIYEAKLELIAALQSRSFAVLPADDSVLLHKAKAYKIKKITVGMSESAERRITNVSVKKNYVHFTLDDDKNFSFPGVAPFMAQNAAMAVVMAEILGVSTSEMTLKWDGFQMPVGRFSSKKILEDVQLIDDTYNASPFSFEKAIDAFSELKIKGRKFLVIADMLELGFDEKKWHSKLGTKIGQSSIDSVYAYGALTPYTLEAIAQSSSSIMTQFFRDPQELALSLRDRLRPGDAILLKGSRGMRVEQVIDGLHGDRLQKA